MEFQWPIFTKVRCCYLVVAFSHSAFLTCQNLLCNRDFCSLVGLHVQTKCFHIENDKQSKH